MNYREVELLAAKDYTADATELIDLDMKDPISQIQICVEGMGTESNASSGHPARLVTDVTIKDGSDILYNLSGAQAHAANYYANDIVTPGRLRYLNNNMCEIVLLLNFGRKLWDKELALDPSNFSNLQLSFSMDEDAGGIAPDALRARATASLFDDRKIEPVGFFTHKEHKSYTGGSATHERVNLPTDNAYRLMFFRCQKYGTTPDSLYDVLKLEEDNGKKIPFDLPAFEILRHIQARWHPYREAIVCPGHSAGAVQHCTPAWETWFSACQWASVVNGYSAAAAGSGGRTTVSSSVIGINVQLLCTGWCPHGTLAYPFGDQQDLTDWYEMENVESLVLDTLNKSGGSDQTFEIFSQQLRRY